MPTAKHRRDIRNPRDGCFCLDRLAEDAHKSVLTNDRIISDDCRVAVGSERHVVAI